MFENSTRRTLMNGTECPQMTEDQLLYLVFSEWLINGVIQMFICIVGEKNYILVSKIKFDVDIFCKE